MKKIFLLVLVLAGVYDCVCKADDRRAYVQLQGTWEFMIDRDDTGEKKQYYKPDYKYDDTIVLPGSMPQRMKGDDISTRTKWVGAIYDSSYYHNPFMEKYRKEGEMKLPFFLTPCKHYVGKAWYRKTVVMNDEADRTGWTLLLERPHITTKVWVNGTLLEGEQNSLSVPHRWNLGTLLKRGKNTIVICVDNDPTKVNVGNDSHSVTDQTQGCWNGIVGRIELLRTDCIGGIQVYPDVDSKTAKVLIKLNGINDETATATLTATSYNTGIKHVISSTPCKVSMKKGAETTLEEVMEMGDGMLLWDEYNPNMYRLNVEVTTSHGTCSREVYFGMRKVEIRGKMFYVNGRKVLLRGNVDSCLFPDTGYPPTDLDTWIEIFRKQKEWGINHIRFHSYCPPENAFLAADIVGMYLQPEGPSWPNHGVRLGRGEYIDTYLKDEALRICDEYGSHPSFMFFAFGNEPAGNWVKWCNDHIPLMKEYDSRHIYAGFSVGGGWAWQPMSEFAVKAGARGLAEWVRTAPESMADFSDKISTYNGKDMPGTPITVPFVTHEMGQWCAFPNFDEIGKYKGVNKAKNFEIFRDLLSANGMECRGKDFLMASGKLQALCYKYEIERLLRTPDYAGYQLLALNDYSGQGSALVGVTDVFFDSKGYITAPEFREFCSSVVPLAKFPKFTYCNNESFRADISVSNYSGKPIAALSWQLADSKNGIIASGADSKVDVPLNRITEPQKLTLTVDVKTSDVAFSGHNHWNVWVYPSPELPSITSKGTKHGDIMITDTLDAKAQKVLRKGGKVLLLAHGKTTYGKEVVQQFLPVFWNTSWFKMRPPHTTGLYIEHNHPVFDGFPTDYHSDLQWWELINRAPVMQLTDFPTDFQPLVQSIDTWFVSRKIGMLFEARIGKGRLMMTTMDLTSDLEHRHVARTMRQSIIDYMQQDNLFQPKHSVDMRCVSDLFTKTAGEVNMFTNDSPDELKPVLK